MRSGVVAFAFTLTGFFAGAAFFIATSLVLAWTGPTSAPPSGNVSAPINIGTTYQEKQGVLGALGILNTGSLILFGANRYLAFNSTADATGYGIRDNAGTLEFKNNAGSWNNLTNTVTNVLGIGAVTQIKFSDGTTQTSAPSGGGISAVTSATCTFSYSFP